MRLRDLDLSVGLGTPGPHNAITDVPGVLVGHTTLIEGEGPLLPGRGPVRTGVTVIRPVPGYARATPVLAGTATLNGNGELTGLEWVRESGLLTTPIALTNTHSVGVVRDALVADDARQAQGIYWSLPVVGETYDGILNDINGQHVRAEHVHEALASASDGHVQEGSVGGGTGMIAHGFKGGIGTSSRRVTVQGSAYTLGVLVQANYGLRADLRVDGLPIGRCLGADVVPMPSLMHIAPPEEPLPSGSGSIIIVIATDAPLLAEQSMRLRDLVLSVGLGNPGPHNAITDVAGVHVGHTTLVSGDGPLDVGSGPVRTGVTVIKPVPGHVRVTPLPAGTATLNGNGELTGLEWVRESGLSGERCRTNVRYIGRTNRCRRPSTVSRPGGARRPTVLSRSRRT